MICQTQLNLCILFRHRQKDIGVGDCIEPTPGEKIPDEYPLVQ